MAGNEGRLLLFLLNLNMTSTKVTSLVTMATALCVLLLLLPLSTDSVSLRHQQHRRQIEEDAIVDTPPPVAMALRPRKMSSVDRPDMVTMIPQQSCYYQAWNKRLTCNCNSTDTAAFLHLKMKYYVTGRDSADISAVYLQQCKELVVILDLNKVDASMFPIHFRSIMKVRTLCY